MRLTEFTWKETGEYQNIGLIAQELEEINPSLVSNVNVEGVEHKIVNNSKLIYYSIKGIQEIDEVINKQQNEIDELRKEVEELKKIIKENK